jgi:uncharacterized membrane protein YeaQ/YmgE (transglycosylase-associated protein family)
MDFLWFIIVGGIAGWLAGMIMRGGGFGLFGNIAVGIVGALIGGMLFLSRIESYGTIGAIFVSLIGAIILLAIIGLVRRGKPTA